MVYFRRFFMIIFLDDTICFDSDSSQTPLSFYNSVRWPHTYDTGRCVGVPLKCICRVL